MELLLGLVVVLLVAVLSLIVYVFFVRGEKSSKTPESMLLMQQQIQELSRTVQSQMTEQAKLAQQGSQMKFKESRELMKKINRDVNEQIRSIQESVGAKL